eukprot:s219_g3.t1
MKNIQVIQEFLVLDGKCACSNVLGLGRPVDQAQFSVDKQQHMEKCVESQAQAQAPREETSRHKCANLEEEKQSLQAQLEDSGKTNRANEELADSSGQTQELQEAVEALEGEKQSLQATCAHREAQKEELVRQLEEASASESIYKEETDWHEKLNRLQAESAEQQRQQLAAREHAEDAQAAAGIDSLVASMVIPILSPTTKLKTTVSNHAVINIVS